MRESMNYQKGKGTQTVGEMEEGAHKVKLGIQEMRKPNGRKTQGKQKTNKQMQFKARHLVQGSY